MVFIQDNVQSLFGIRLAGVQVALYAATVEGAIPVASPTGTPIALLSTDAAGNFAFEDATVSGGDFYLLVYPPGSSPTWYYHYRPRAVSYLPVATAVNQVGSGWVTGTTVVPASGGSATVSPYLPFFGYNKLSIWLKSSIGATYNVLGSPLSDGTAGAVLVTGTLTLNVWTLISLPATVVSPYIATSLISTSTAGTAGCYIYAERSLGS